MQGYLENQHSANSYIDMSQGIREIQNVCCTNAYRVFFPLVDKMGCTEEERVRVKNYITDQCKSNIFWFQES